MALHLQGNSSLRTIGVKRVTGVKAPSESKVPCHIVEGPGGGGEVLKHTISRLENG